MQRPCYTLIWIVFRVLIKYTVRLRFDFSTIITFGSTNCIEYNQLIAIDCLQRDQNIFTFQIRFHTASNYYLSYWNWWHGIDIVDTWFMWHENVTKIMILSPILQMVPTDLDKFHFRCFNKTPTGHTFFYLNNVLFWII